MCLITKNYVHITFAHQEKEPPWHGLNTRLNSPLCLNATGFVQDLGISFIYCTELGDMELHLGDRGADLNVWVPEYPSGNL
jgi:hypothetical protein